MAGSEQGLRFSRILLREQMFPSPAYDTIFEGFLKTVLNSLSTLIMAASGESDIRQATFKAMTFMGQVMIFRVARETIHKETAHDPILHASFRGAAQGDPPDFKGPKFHYPGPGHAHGVADNFRIWRKPGC